MGTPGERKALLFLGVVIVLGGGVRAARAVGDDPGVDPAARAAIDRQIEAVGSVRTHGRKKGKGKRAKKTEVIVPAIIDLDVATAAEIETLRGIGPALAKRIVADRDSLGPFGSLDGLVRVRGIGPATARRLDSTVTFSLVPRLSPARATGLSEPHSGGRKPRRRESKS